MTKLSKEKKDRTRRKKHGEEGRQEIRKRNIRSERKRENWTVRGCDERTRSEEVIKKEGVRQSRVSRVGMKRVEDKEEEEKGLCKAGNTEQRPGGCLDRCRLPLGSPCSSINRPPHNPALPTVGEICPETHQVARANRAKEGKRERGSGWWEAGEDGYTATFRSPPNIYTAEFGLWTHFLLLSSLRSTQDS